METKYAVAISFAEEQTELAETIAAFCKTHSLSCYYYKEDAGTSGQVLSETTRKIYQYESCVIVVIYSKTYGTREFTKQEWELVCERAKSYPESRLLIWVDENSTDVPHRDLGCTIWKGNQYGVFSEILDRTDKCKQAPTKGNKRKEKSAPISNNFRAKNIKNIHIG